MDFETKSFELEFQKNKTSGHKKRYSMMADIYSHRSKNDILVAEEEKANASPEKENQDDDQSIKSDKESELNIQEAAINDFNSLFLE